MSVSDRWDVVILGGGLGSVAAALAGARLGLRVVLVSECEWLGGQATSQAIPPDEHPWIESTGCTAGYREYRDRVRGFYRRNYPLTAAARAQRHLNPGSGNIGPLSHEPTVSALVLEEMLAPWTSRGAIRVLRTHTLLDADVTGDEIRSVRVSGPDGRQIELSGDYFLDGTDLGDLVAASGAEHVVGAESSADTGEPHALDGPPNPLDQQALTWAMVLSWDPQGGEPIDRPEQYEFWRNHRPAHWPGPLLSWTVSDHVTNRPRQRPLLDPAPNGDVPYDLWHARRILDAGHFAGGWNDVTCAAWPMMDYTLRPLVTAEGGDARTAWYEARQLSLSFLHWMQTAAPRHDGGIGYPELRPRPDITGTADGLARRPYIRESRRILAEFTLLEQHIGVEARQGLEGAEPFADSVGIAAYRIDVHPSTAGRASIDLDTWPFQLPLGSFVPVRLRNLLPAGKNIGSTHLTSGAYRVHPGEWSVGEAAGALAAYCIATKTAPAEVRASGRHLADFQACLTGQLGISLAWPRFEALTPRHRFGYVPASDKVG